MTQSKTLFSHPFSAAYWKLAWAQTRNLRILTLAALCMALKMAVASFRIPVGDQLYIYFTYLITAVQCAVCGPVVGVLCGDIQLEEILKHTEDLEAEEKSEEAQA